MRSGAARPIWVVTDQSAHNGPHVAFVRAIVGARPDPAAAPIDHVFVDRKFYSPPQSRSFAAQLRLKCKNVKDQHLVLLFVDAECRDQVRFDNATRDMGALVGNLRGQGFHHCEGVVLNPCSEGALLVADDWLALAQAGAVDPKMLSQHTRDKRANRIVNKDHLDQSLGLSQRKRSLNLKWEGHINDHGLPDCDNACYRATRARLSASIAAYLG